MWLGPYYPYLTRGEISWLECLIKWVISILFELDPEGTEFNRFFCHSYVDEENNPLGRLIQ